MIEERDVVIVGGGIAGLATALALQRTGVKSLVIERSSELRAAGAALSLFPNAWRALDALGVARKLNAIYHPIEIGRVINFETGVVQEVSYTGTGKSDGMGLRGLHRKVLLEALAEDLSPGTIRFSSKLAAIKPEVLDDSSTVTLLELEDGTVIRAKVLIGCDGVYSVVAKWLGQIAPLDSGRAAVRGLSVFPRGHGFKHEVRVFIGRGKRAGFVSLSDTDIYWFITHHTTAEKEMAREDPEAIHREVTENLAKDFPLEFVQVVGNTDLSTLSWAPLMYRAPWDLIVRGTYKGSVTIAGDAFHPMTPELGQGGGTALEDAVVLARNIAPFLNADGMMSGKRVEKGIEEYVKERRWRAAGLILGAYLSGWVQQGGRGGVMGWPVKWFRDHVFFRFIQPKIVYAVQYDCGTLPLVV